MPKTQMRRKGPAVREVLGTQEFTFPNRGPAQGATNYTSPALGSTPQPATHGTPFVAPGHPGLNKIQQQAAAQAQTPRSVAESNPDYVSINLPSLFTFYPFKRLSLTTLKGLHISKIHRANKESSLRALVEAIGSTLEPGVNAMDLVPADFYYIMYWQRVNSYSKTPLIVEVLCTDMDHQTAVVEGWRDKETGELRRDATGEVIKPSKESLTIKEYLNSTTLKVEDYTPIDFNKFADLDSRYPLGFERMRDVVEISEYVAETEDASEFTFLASKAAFLLPTDTARTLKQRCDLVANMSPDDLATLSDYIEAITNFGVSESANIRCKECGASTRVNISFDALTFLPDN